MTNCELPAHITPTQVTGDQGIKVTVAGIHLELVHAPGESPDQVMVWWPKERVLFSADNFYRGFPNLYALRGTKRYEDY